MPLVSFVWGVLAVLGMIIGFIPCLGAFNWLNIPFAAVGVIIAVVAIVMEKGPGRNSAVFGLACSGMAIIVGIIRLSLGGGVV